MIGNICLRQVYKESWLDEKAGQTHSNFYMAIYMIILHARLFI